jgi:hypothetical protein
MFAAALRPAVRALPRAIPQARFVPAFAAISRRSISQCPPLGPKPPPGRDGSPYCMGCSLPSRCCSEPLSSDQSLML